MGQPYTPHFLRAKNTCFKENLNHLKQINGKRERASCPPFWLQTTFPNLGRWGLGTPRMPTWWVWGPRATPSFSQQEQLVTDKVSGPHSHREVREAPTLTFSVFSVAGLGCRSWLVYPPPHFHQSPAHTASVANVAKPRKHPAPPVLSTPGAWRGRTATQLSIRPVHATSPSHVASTLTWFLMLPCFSSPGTRGHRCCHPLSGSPTACKQHAVPGAGREACRSEHRPWGAAWAGMLAAHLPAMCLWANGLIPRALLSSL